MKFTSQIIPREISTIGIGILMVIALWIVGNKIRLTPIRSQENTPYP